MDCIQDDAKLLFQIEGEINKTFNENNRLKKQGALSDDSSIYTCSRKFKKDYLFTYIRAYDSNVDEVQIDGLEDLVNPNIYKNGIFVMSKYQQKEMYCQDSQIGDNNSTIDSSGPLNSTELSDYGDTSLDDIQDVIVEEYKVINCGNCELFATDVNMGGRRAFHGALGEFTKFHLSLSHFTPVSSVNGRYLSSVYIQFLKQVSMVSAPVFLVFCQPKIPMNICKLILFPELAEDLKCRLHIVTVFDGGNGKVGKTTREENTNQSTFLSTYDLFHQTFSSSRIKTSNTSLQIEFHWSANESEPMKAPPPSAKPVIHLQVAIGQQQSAANEPYLEVKRLDTLVSTPINTTNVSVFCNNSSSYSEEVQIALKHFKEAVANIQFYNLGVKDQKASEGENTEDIEKPMSQILMESFWHKDIDFTDALWSLILKSSEMEIRYILEDVLTDIVSGSLQPAISPNNATKLAKQIRKFYVAVDDESKVDAEEKIMEMISNEHSILNLVKEIGFEKLRKDYFNFFLNKGLTSLSSLQKICKPAVFDIKALWKLHYCLEIVITPTIYLNLSPDVQCTLLAAAIDHYSVNAVNGMSPMFHLALLPFHESSASLQCLCGDRQPVMWQHGIVCANKPGFAEATMRRTVVTSFEEGNLKEEKMFLREENIPLPC